MHALSLGGRSALIVSISVGTGLFSATSEAAPITRGFAVVAEGGAGDSAAPLARAVYGHPSLRPYAGIDESRAHVLLGETAPSNLQDLASTRAAIHGDDAPSVKLLSSIASDFRLRGIIVVSCEAGQAPPPSTWGASSSPASAPPACSPVARVFLDAAPAKPAHFESETYRPDISLDPGKPTTWNATVAAIDSEYGVALPAAKSAPAAATSTTPKDETKKSHAFYESPWFWGALGAAAFAGTAVFLATRDNGGDTIHLQMQVPQQ